jgi:arylsulfatase A
MKTLLSSFIVATALTGLGHAADKQPNIIFIMADDLGYNHLSVYGQERLQTPNIDSLAAKGIRFTSAYAGCTVCGPSRSSLMTGLHGGHIPYKSNPQFTDLDPVNITIGEIFKKSGYSTGYFGKWGLAGKGSNLEPNDLGYDEFLGLLSHGHGHRHFPKYVFHNRKKLPLNVTKSNGNTSTDKADRKTHTHDAFTDGALKFIRNSADKKKPFFCFLSYSIPHTEIIATDKEANEFIAKGWPEDYVARTASHIAQDKPRAHYAGMLRMVDNSVGSVVAAVAKLKLEQDTLIIFTSDNGGQLKQVWGNAPSPWFKANGVLRGGKQELYEGGIRVPFIAYWKGKTPIGKVTDHPCYFADMLPSFCQAIGAMAPEKIDGHSIMPTILGNDKEQKKHDYLYWCYRGNKAVLKGSWKAVKIKNKPVQLYDLSKDPSEKTNVASKQPELAAEMEEIILEAHKADSTKPRPSKHSPSYPKE